MTPTPAQIEAAARVIAHNFEGGEQHWMRVQNVASIALTAAAQIERMNNLIDDPNSASGKRIETEMEHIARDIREGRFPEKSPAQAGEPIDYVELIGKREIEWRTAAEDHVDEIEKLKAELAAIIEAAAKALWMQADNNADDWENLSDDLKLSCRLDAKTALTAALAAVRTQVGDLCISQHLYQHTGTAGPRGNLMKCEKCGKQKWESF